VKEHIRTLVNNTTESKINNSAKQIKSNKPPNRWSAC